MNRAVKFRAWDKTSKCYVNIVSIDFDENGEVEFVHVDNTSHHHDHYMLNRGEVELGQCTGLEDMNGKEIYEGDVVHDEEYGGDFFVKWLDLFAGFALKPCGRDNGGRIALNHATISMFEAVGNIHENPELLGTDTSVRSKEKKNESK